MIPVRRLFACAALVLALNGGGPALAAAPPDVSPLPGESLYQLPVTLETMAGTTEPFARHRGRPVLVTMFYTHCESVCPILTAELQRLDSRLPVEQRARIAVVMVSLDSEADTPAELRRFAAEHKITDPRWTLARTSPAEVRTLAAALGIRFKKLPDGSFDHSTTIVLLDAEGVPRDRTSELLGTSDRFVDAVATLVRRESR